MRFFRKWKKGYIGPEVIIVAALVMTFGSLATYKLVFKGSETTAHSETAFTKVTETVRSTNPGYERPSDPGPEGGPGSSQSYQITYELNGGTQGALAVDTYTSSQKVILPEPSKTGVHFGGWFESSDCTGKALFALERGTTGNKTLYAKWNDSEGPQAFAIYSEDDYSLRFYNNYDVVNVGDEYRGLNTTAVYYGVHKGKTGWATYRENVKAVIIVEEFTAPSSMLNWFSNFINCEQWIDFNKIDVSNTTNFRALFYYSGRTAKKFIVDLSEWDVSKGNNFLEMFDGAGVSAEEININLKGWNIGERVTTSTIYLDMMFSGLRSPNASQFTLDLSGWSLNHQNINISAVFNWTGYYSPDVELDVSGWDAGKFTGLSYTSFINYTSFKVFKTPYNISEDQIDLIIKGTWYDATTGEIITAENFPLNSPYSYTLVKTKPN